MALLTIPLSGLTRPAPGCLMFATCMQTDGLSTAQRVLRLTGAVRRAAAHSDGCLGVTVAARPPCGTYMTLSAWSDDAALRAFVACDVHQEAVRTILEVGGIDTRFASWTSDGARLRSCWPEAVHHLHEVAPTHVPRAGHRRQVGAHG